MFKLGYLSEVHTDFALAGIAEEVGALGVTLLTLIIITIIYRIFKIASRSSNKVYYLIFGCIITSLIYSCLYNNLSAELNNIIEQLNMLK